MSDNDIRGIDRPGQSDRQRDPSEGEELEGVEQIERIDLDEIPKGQLQPIVPEIDSVEDEMELRRLMKDIGIEGVTRAPETFRSTDEIRQALEDITPGELGTLPQRPGREAIRFPNLANLVEVIRIRAPGEEVEGPEPPTIPEPEIDIPDEFEVDIPEDSPGDTDFDRIVNRLDVIVSAINPVINRLDTIIDFLNEIETSLDNIEEGPLNVVTGGLVEVVDYGRIEFSRSGNARDLINQSSERTKFIIVTADDVNDDNIWIGDSGVAVNDAFALGPGQTEVLPANIRQTELNAVAESANDAYTFLALDASS